MKPLIILNQSLYKKIEIEKGARNWLSIHLIEVSLGKGGSRNEILCEWKLSVHILKLIL